MRLGKMFFGIGAALCLLVGCSKQAAQESAPIKTVNLGTLELTPGQPSRHDLDNGQVCVITANTLDASTLEVVASIEKSGKQLASNRVVPVLPDRPLDMTFGGIQLQFTPHLK